MEEQKIGQIPEFKKEPEDIFSTLDNKPSSMPEGTKAIKENDVPANIMTHAQNSSDNSKKYVIVISSIIFLFVIGVIVYMILTKSDTYIKYNNMTATTTPTIPATPTTTVIIPIPAQQPSSDVGTTTQPNMEIIPIVIDSDNDKLIDSEEVAIGTNINKTDTDDDGLYDYEEVKIYTTNPLSKDTDNDGYNDKQEIMGGYNPKGPGKLLGVQGQVPEAPKQ